MSLNRNMRYIWPAWPKGNIMFSKTVCMFFLHRMCLGICGELFKVKNGGEPVTRMPKKSIHHSQPHSKIVQVIFPTKLPNTSQ